MGRPRYRRSLRIGLAATVAVVGACSSEDDGGSAADEPGSAPAETLYVDPDSQVAAWVADHPDDNRTAQLRDWIAVEPQAHWFVEADPATIAADVRAYVEPASEAGEVPVLVPYAIPDRDCGGASSGGAADLAAWSAWIEGMAESLGTAMGDSRSIVVVEPDSLAQEDCLDAAGADARHAVLAQAVTTFAELAPSAEVYLDGGHSDWNPAGEQARRLRAAGVLDAAGFATNVSNFNGDDAEVAYGEQLLDELGDPDLRQVVDVSRNGNGPAPGGEWCDPPARALGRPPTLDTGVATVAGFLWVKPPGEADGCVAAPGIFLPDHASALATAADSRLR